MSKTAGLKWIALFSGSAIAAFNLGTCITYYLLLEYESLLNRLDG